MFCTLNVFYVLYLGQIFDASKIDLDPTVVFTSGRSKAAVHYENIPIQIY